MVVSCLLVWEVFSENPGRCRIQVDTTPAARNLMGRSVSSTRPPAEGRARTDRRRWRPGTFTGRGKGIGDGKPISDDNHEYNHSQCSACSWCMSRHVVLNLFDPISRRLALGRGLWRQISLADMTAAVTRVVAFARLGVASVLLFWKSTRSRLHACSCVSSIAEVGSNRGATKACSRLLLVYRKGQVLNVCSSLDYCSVRLNVLQLIMTRIAAHHT